MKNTEKQLQKLTEEWKRKIKKMSPHLKPKEVQLLAEVAAEAKLSQKIKETISQ